MSYNENFNYLIKNQNVFCYNLSIMYLFDYYLSIDLLAMLINSSYQILIVSLIKQKFLSEFSHILYIFVLVFSKNFISIYHHNT